MFGIAVFGRVFDVVVAGGADGAVRAIIVEFVIVAFSLVAARWLPSK
ncbi:MAG: hypothetical protein AAFZ91_12755 [Pseudomonadota bacterium]